MGAYNRINGDPACTSQFLLGEVLRGRWQFKGHVVSDCGALTDIYATHKVAADPVEAAVMALTAGCDMSCGCTYDHLAEAVERGLITETDINRSLARTLLTRFKLGVFDPPESVTVYIHSSERYLQPKTQAAGARSCGQVHRLTQKQG